MESKSNPNYKCNQQKKKKQKNQVTNMQLEICIQMEIRPAAKNILRFG